MTTVASGEIGGWFALCHMRDDVGVPCDVGVALVASGVGTVKSILHAGIAPATDGSGRRIGRVRADDCGWLTMIE